MPPATPRNQTTYYFRDYFPTIFATIFRLFHQNCFPRLERGAAASTRVENKDSEGFSGLEVHGVGEFITRKLRREQHLLPTNFLRKFSNFEIQEGKDDFGLGLPAWDRDRFCSVVLINRLTDRSQSSARNTSYGIKTTSESSGSWSLFSPLLYFILSSTCDFSRKIKVYSTKRKGNIFWKREKTGSPTMSVQTRTTQGPFARVD